MTKIHALIFKTFPTHAGLVTFLFSLIAGPSPSSAAEAITLATTQIETMALQESGRVKPFDTFARESVQLITGRQYFQKKNPNELVLSWLFMPTVWSNQKIFQIKHLQLKKELGWDEKESYFTPAELFSNQKLMVEMNAVAKLQADSKGKAKLNKYQNAVNRVKNQIAIYSEIVSGSGLKVIPQKLSGDWLSLAEIKDENRVQFEKVAKAYLAAIAHGHSAEFSKAVENFKMYAIAQAPEKYPKPSDLKLEVTYNHTHPFRVAYFFYIAAFVLFILALKWPKRIFSGSAMTLLIGGALVHIAGFVMRCLIAKRPPVSNMYESIIWVSLGCVVFGIIFELIYRRKFIGIGASLMGFLCLVAGDAAPAVIDPSIQPLVAVLNSNFWLTVHVLTITLSYAALTLATGIANIALFIYIRGRAAAEREKLSELSFYVYKAMQVGVLLLTAGTILGGVWADQSWGRFWGWDPKETWALIADLCYLAILHGRFTGWLRTFGTIAASVGAYTSVIMAWYGVNFVLGEGLHTYGFGAGGLEYVAVYMGLQLGLLGLAALRFKNTPSAAVS